MQVSRAITLAVVSAILTPLILTFFETQNVLSRTQITTNLGGLTYVPITGDVWPPTDGIWMVGDNGVASQLVEGTLYSPAWSRDGSRLAYIREDGPDGTGAGQIEIINFDGSDQTVVVPPRESPRQGGDQTAYVYYSSVRWNADDTAIYYNWSIGVRGGQGISRLDLANGQEVDLDFASVILGAAFDVAADGTIVALGDPGTGARGELNLYLVREGAEPRTLLTMGGATSFSNPAWSPGANKVALELNGSLSIIGRDGRFLQEVVAVTPVDDISWSPDGSTLAYVSTDYTIGLGSSMIWTVSADGGSSTEHFAGIHSTWRPTSISPLAASAVRTETCDTSVPSISSAMSESYFGTRSGKNVQTNPSMDWPVTITINQGDVGTAIGTSEYPEEECGGDQFLRQVTTEAITLLEDLTFGEANCTDGGTITLALQEDGTMTFDWVGTRSDSGNSCATGVLVRQGN